MMILLWIAAGNEKNTTTTHSSAWLLLFLLALLLLWLSVTSVVAVKAAACFMTRRATCTFPHLSGRDGTRYRGANCLQASLRALLHCSHCSETQYFVGFVGSSIPLSTSHSFLSSEH